MSKTNDLLFEIGTEELPPKALFNLATALSDNIIAGLEKAALPFGECHVFASPRRLAVRVTNIAIKQADRDIERHGPALDRAYDTDGKPTPAALGFARSCGVALKDLAETTTDKGACLVFKQRQVGKACAQLLPDIVSQAATKLPIPKAMRWGELETTFVRPVHWVLALLGRDILPITLFGQRAGNKTYGHRFHSPKAVVIKQAEDYEKVLAKHYVVADFVARRERIAQEIERIAGVLGANAVVPLPLLDEVCGLVEWPVGLVAKFDEAFLDVPAEALISSMQYHQKAFPVKDNSGKLLPCFITISNIESKRPAVLIEGNEKVMRARLADAAFFYEQDKKQPLASHLETQKSVIFQNKLGTLFDKSERVANLAVWIAGQLDADTLMTKRAAQLAKCDLMTKMVGEFPELQGVMGAYYAQHDGEPAEVVNAINAHYLPRFAGDDLPDDAISMSVALADRLDTLVGIFGIGQHPTGDKDPFALRRAALAVMRILIEKALPLDLKALLEQAKQGYGDKVAGNIVEEVLAFCFERLRHYYAEKQIPMDAVQAVMACQSTYPYDFHRRVLAVEAFRALPEADALAMANKRVSKLLAKQETKIAEGLPAENLLQETQEKALATQIIAKQKQLTSLEAASDYTQVLAVLAELKQPIDDFFDHVMVMVDDDALRGNRLLLLANLRALFLQVADISELQA